MIIKICDYTNAFHEETEIMDMEKRQQAAATYGEEVLTLLEELRKTTDEQFEYQKDVKRWNQLEHTYFPAFCQLAESYCSRAELIIYEDTKKADLVFRGEEFFMPGQHASPLMTLLDIIADADEVFLTGDEDAFELRLCFNLYNKIKIADRSQQISALHSRLKEIAKAAQQ